MNATSRSLRPLQPRRRFVTSALAAMTGLGAACVTGVGRAAEKVAAKASAISGQPRRYALPTWSSGVEDLPEDIYGDLLLMRKGTPSMLMGGSPTTVEPIQTLDEWRTKAAALREIFDFTLGTAPLQDCPLALRVEKETDRGTVIERRVSYLLSPGERVASLLLVPKGIRGRRAAVLTIHPTTALGKEQAVGRGDMENGVLTPAAVRRAYGLHLAEKGYVTFSPDLLGAGERLYPGRRSFDNQPFIDAHPRWSGTGKDLHDLQRALDVMELMPEVDGARIASLGHSQGAGLTCYLAAVDPRIKVGVANCGAYSSRIQNNPFNIARPAWWTGRQALRPFMLAAKPLPIDVHELLAMAAPRAFLNIVALNDVGFKEADEPLTRRSWEDMQRNVKKVYALHGAEERFEIKMHLKGHDFHDDMRAYAYAFLERHLGQP